MPASEWLARARRIDRQVTALAARVNARRLARYHQQQEQLDDETPDELTAAAILAGLFAPPERLPPRPIVIAEQVAWHRLAGDVSNAVADEIAANPALYPGVKVVEYTRRAYASGSLAAHLIGHLGPSDAAGGESPDARRMGAMGVEARHETTLAGRPGVETRFTDRRGNVVESRVVRPATPGGDVVLSIDASLQRTAESLLDRSLRRGDDGAEGHGARGGAIVVLDANSGEVLAAARRRASTRTGSPAATGGRRRC